MYIYIYIYIYMYLNLYILIIFSQLTLHAKRLRKTDWCNSLILLVDKQEKTHQLRNWIICDHNL